MTVKQATPITAQQLKERIRTLEPFVGGSPLYPLSRIIHKPGVTLFAKLEWQQMGGSIKARPAFRIIKEAIHQGSLFQGKTLLDASSGNTGIAYAAFCRALGLHLALCLPENASAERKTVLKALNTHLHLTSALGTTDQAQDKAMEIQAASPGKYFYADQYNNPANWKAHYLGTGKEILDQTGGNVTHFVAGLGTTGTLTGTGKKLKEYDPAIRLTGLQPTSPMHDLEGWKHLETAKVPGIYHSERVDEIMEVDSEEAFHWIKKAAREEGLLLSPSSAANLLGAVKTAEKLEQGTVVTVFPDNIQRYSDVFRELFN